jgi:hypothetical protein
MTSATMQAGPTQTSGQQNQSSGQQSLHDFLAGYQRPWWESGDPIATLLAARAPQLSTQGVGGDIGAQLGQWIAGSQGKQVGQVGGDVLEKLFSMLAAQVPQQAPQLSTQGVGGDIGAQLGQWIAGSQGKQVGQVGGDVLEKALPLFLSLLASGAPAQVAAR